MSTTADKVDLVWNKAQYVSPEAEEKGFRKDRCTAWIRRSEYGNRNSAYGWEIDHIDPNGSDELSNLQPLQWENNVAKSDGSTNCVVKSDGNQNVRD